MTDPEEPQGPSPTTVDAPSEVVRWEEPIDDVRGLTGFIARASRLGLGVAGLAVGATTDAIDRLGPGPATAGGSTLRRLPSAALGLGMAASERVLAVSAQVESSAGFAVQAARSLPVVGSTIAAGDRAVERWSERGTEEQAGNEALLGAFVARLVPELAAAIVERLDLAGIVAAIPIDLIMEQIDVDAIVARVDVDALVRRVDVDAIVGRVDVNRIMERVDIAPMAAEVLDTVDIGQIVRESTGTVTGDIVDSARIQSMQLDTFVNRIVDAVLLRRRRERAHVGEDWTVRRPGPTTDGSDPGPADPEATVQDTTDPASGPVPGEAP
ncbi:MAG: hypothetical protein ACKO72_04815 [Actinomycetes bacterium]